MIWPLLHLCHPSLTHGVSFGVFWLWFWHEKTRNSLNALSTHWRFGSFHHNLLDSSVFSHVSYIPLLILIYHLYTLFLLCSAAQRVVSTENTLLQNQKVGRDCFHLRCVTSHHLIRFISIFLLLIKMTLPLYHLFRQKAPSRWKSLLPLELFFPPSLFHSSMELDAQFQKSTPQ